MPRRATNRLTLRIEGRDEAISLRSVVRVLRETLAILQEIDQEMSESGRASLRWAVAEAGMSSPLTFTIVGVVEGPDPHGGDVTATCLAGMRQLERGDVAPAYFTPEALGHAKGLASTTGDGVAGLVLSGPEQPPVVPTPHLAANVEAILRRSRFVAETTLEGRLETLNVHGGLSFVIYDVLTNHPVKCLFGEEMLDQAVGLLRRRVAVTGEATYSRIKRRPVSIRAGSMRALGQAVELPQFLPGEEIDLTGGLPSEEFVRRQRDAE